MNIQIPEFALVILVGVSGSGKSTFARTHFKPTEILSSDFCRAIVSDDENDQTVSQEAFDTLHYILSKRLTLKRLTVIDATNTQAESRKNLLAIARQYHCLPVAIVLDMPETLCRERNETRPDRAFGYHVISHQQRELRRSMKLLQKEGFRYIYTLRSPAEVDSISITRTPLYNNRQWDKGAFDIIGDIHGCYDELVSLLTELGYQVHENGQVTPPEGRKAVFLGDLVDRGPKITAVLRLVMGMVAAGTALCVVGNHDAKLLRALNGRKVQITHGLDQSLAQIATESPAFKAEVIHFLDSLVSHYVLDGGQLVVAHAGMKAEMQGRASGAVRAFALYGETTGETDEFGLPIRYNWAMDYRGQAMVVYGHTPVPTADWLNRTVNIDTGCVFGGELTALRYPEGEFISIPALAVYAEPIRPLENAAPHALSLQQEQDDMLDMADVMGKRVIQTRLKPSVIIRAEQAAAALEIMSRFAIDPKWLIYLPPTMSPCQTSPLADYLEHPQEAFDYYRTQGVPTVICQEKHMGSRAMVLVCRDESVARRRFGVLEASLGACYTRTGRAFFNDPVLEQAFLQRLQTALTLTNFWEAFQTEWVLLDGELMPWSAKAQALIRGQYAAVGAAAQGSLAHAQALLQQTQTRTEAITPLAIRQAHRLEQVSLYQSAYRGYCWEVEQLTDLKFAPFHLLATEGAVHTDKSHLWHLEQLATFCQDALFQATNAIQVNLLDQAECETGIAWWANLTQNGGEGMVVKPLDFIYKGVRGVIQPAVKCRGREYLRIIYGLEYTDHLPELRRRSLGGKQALALREFALGVEAMERFVRREPLRRVHECVFGILALESEPIDPRL